MGRKIVKVPGVNGLGNTSGTRNAGNLLLEKVEGGRVEEIHVDNDNLNEQEKLIFQNSRDLFLEEESVVFLGGDHSISYSICRAFFEKFKNGKLVVFDAHADCMPAMKEPTHEEWLRALIERYGITGDRIMIIGLNKVEPEEKEFLDKMGVKQSESVEELKEFLDGSKLYVSFDIDVFKDALATGYPEGKMSKEKIIELVEIVSSADWKGMDLVEINLDKEGVEETLELANVVLRNFL